MEGPECTTVPAMCGLLHYTHSICRPRHSNTVSSSFASASSAAAAGKANPSGKCLECSASPLKIRVLTAHPNAQDSTYRKFPQV
eukprot:5683332-Amphidinium_carterae.1